ncbi:ribosomal protein S5, C-terminal domain-domain-containing protein [Ostreococcus tauri]|uniref:Ribosomal protein S5, C-terminal domain-domain-containing protein n=1 Tax=Ostreococcus tauri TaxID=70448 RepID=A0A1Y5I3L2_OSTTA|nr:ribosomal protein S5, C-terminal domain-domain-containing protein [Ostreococcus tauri]
MRATRATSLARLTANALASSRVVNRVDGSFNPIAVAHGSIASQRGFTAAGESFRRPRAFGRSFASESGASDDGTDGAPVDAKDAALRRRYEALFARFENAPSKQRRFLLNLALKGQMSVADEDDGEEGGQSGFRNRALMTRVIDVNRTNKVTKGGDLTNFTALVVVGNGDGVIGFGSGKGADVGLAIDKAYRKASRSLVYVKRFDEHTIYHEVKGKYCKTLAVMLPAASGSGIVANDTVEAICTLAGIKNIKAKIHGSHHPHNTVRAVFDALEAVESPEDVAERTGMNIYRDRI